MPDARFNSVSFAPFRAWQSPLTENFPTRIEVEQDVARIADRTAGLRTYAAIEGEYDVAAIAQAYHLKLWQGIWLGPDRARNDLEITRAIAIANRYPDTVERVVVGNEVLLRRDLPPEELAADIDRVRAAIPQKVTYADVWEFWERFPDLARHVDIVTIHILPYWEDHPTGIDHAIDHVREIYQHMKARFPDKPIAIGETGWPSRGRWRRDAAPGLVNQAVFLRRFISLAHREGFDYNLIEAFDQIWKYQNEGTVGANWGLWTASRQPKFPLAGPLVENPDWPFEAALSLLFAAFLLAPILSRPAMPPSTQIRAAALAIVLGNALGFACSATTPDLYDIHQRIAAIGNLAAQALLAALLLHRLTGAAPPWRTGAQAADTIRLLLRLQRPGAWSDIFPALSFVFVWTAAFLQLLLVFDPRYRDFPLPTFAVPLVAVLARALLRDLPRSGGGREELCVGATLAVGAIAGAIIEGPANLQSLAWSATALILATPPLLMCAAPATT